MLVAGCDQLLGVNDITLGDGGKQPGSDGGGGGSACIAGAGQTDAMDSLFAACFQTLPSNTITITGAIDTDTDSRCSVQHQANNGPDVCVIGAGTMMVTGTVRVTGGKPLVLAATMDLTVSGLIDLRGIAGQTAPAAADQSPCLPTGNGIFSMTSPGGAGGAGFGAGGAPGGGMGGQGGPPDSPPMYVRGGCSGGFGAGQTATSNGGARGQGGGGIYLVANNSITVNSGASIEASGGGGGGSAYGGGGGGTGGMIGLDSPFVEVDGDVISNGGGGGGGGGSGAAGTTGSTGSLASAAGGQGVSSGGGGGDGGIGATGPTPGGAPGNCAGPPCGGGGGGGGVGVIWMNYTGAGITGNVVPDSIP